MVPRWRDTKASRTVDELRFSPNPKASEEGNLERSLSLESSEASWRENKQLGFALDHLSNARILGHSEAAKEAAEFVLDAGTLSTPYARVAAREVLQHFSHLQTV